MALEACDTGEEMARVFGLKSIPLHAGKLHTSLHKDPDLLQYVMGWETLPNFSSLATTYSDENNTCPDAELYVWLVVFLHSSHGLTRACTNYSSYSAKQDILLFRHTEPGSELAVV